MSHLRILIGLVLAALVLAGELVVYWHFGFEAKWVPIVLFAVLALAGGTLIHYQTWKALGPYWEAGLHRHSLAASLSSLPQD
ncbi:MAG TPA: hypothetical protein VN673_07525 [Clostridia bacterium]|nr:hypothetical protein [Clostridia bacterium]